MRMSAQTDELFAALAKAQGEIEDPIRSKKNPHFKSDYVPLEAARDAAQAVLAKHGLYVGHIPETDEQGRQTVVTMIAHASGQWMSSSFLLQLAPNATMQQFGSAMTYARRYSFMAALGLAGEKDDDGNSATEAPPHYAPRQPPRPIETPKVPTGPAPSNTLSRLLAKLADLPDLESYERFIGQAKVDQAILSLSPEEGDEWRAAVFKFRAKHTFPEAAE